MSHSFVRLYLIKCVVCVLNYMFDQTKKIFDNFICIWKWFLSPFMFMFSAYFVFHCFKHVLCWKKKKVSEFFHDSLASHETGKMHFLHIFWFFGREVCDSLMSEHSSRQKDFKNFMKIVFVTHLTTRLVMKRLETAF